jgi:hypothetical protein
MTASVRVAFCISGQLRDDHITFPRLGELARELQAQVFISTWRRRGTKSSGVINRDQIMRMFGGDMGAALPAGMVGGNNFNEAHPAGDVLRGDAGANPRIFSRRAHRHRG